MVTMLITTIVITMIMMTDGNQIATMMSWPVTGTNIPRCGQEHDDDNIEGTSISLI